MLPKSDDDQFLEACFGAGRGIYDLDEAGVNAVPERISGHAIIPHWLRDYVISHGGRIYHRTSGPIPHFVSVFETGHEIRFDRFGLCPIENTGSSVDVGILFPDPEHGDLVSPFSFDLSTATHLYDLIALAITKYCRLDLLRLTSSGQLEMLHSTRIDLPDHWLSALRAIIIPTLRNRFGSDSVAFRTAFLQEKSRWDPGAGFLMCDHGKSEQLFLEVR